MDFKNELKIDSNLSDFNDCYFWSFFQFKNNKTCPRAKFTELPDVAELRKRSSTMLSLCVTSS